MDRQIDRKLVVILITSIFAANFVDQASGQENTERQQKMQALQSRQRQQQLQQAPSRQQTQAPARNGTQQANPQQANPQQANQTRQPKPPGMPFQLTPAQQKRVDELLEYWEVRSGKVKTYSCEFMRFDYDHVFGPKDPNLAKTKSAGTIRFAAPDKGEFRVSAIGRYTPGPNGSKASWPMKKEATEHWICNGTSVFEMNAARKQLIERKLPPEMRGTQIADGPLPFMFGAKKQKLMQRYWIQELPPPNNAKGQYLLEAYPRLAETAAEFQRVRVILDEKTFLPNAIEVYPPNYNPKTNPSRTVYVFTNRRVNDPIHRAREFVGGFISPKTPRGWKKIVQDFNDPAPAPSVARAPAATKAKPAANRNQR